jgi:hypothetical protein
MSNPTQDVKDIIAAMQQIFGALEPMSLVAKARILECISILYGFSDAAARFRDAGNQIVETDEYDDGD